MAAEERPASLASLSAHLLRVDDERSAEAGDRRTITDEELIGVGEAPLSTRDAVRQGGRLLLAAMMAFVLVDGISNSVLTVLGPDIQTSLGVSDAMLGAIGGASGVLFVLGAVPLAAIADRWVRTRLATLSTLAYSVLSLLCAFVPNPFWLFTSRMAVGLAASHQLPVHSSLISDAYPMSARGKVFAVHGVGGLTGAFVGPFVVGAIAAVAGAQTGWRWSYAAIAVLAVAVTILLAATREPERGANEQADAVGAVFHDDAPPVSLPMAFARLNLIRTFRFMLIGLGAVGFALFSVPIFLNTLLEDHFGLSAFERGVVGSLAVLPGFISVPLGGRVVSTQLLTSPPRAVLTTAGLIGAYGVLITLALPLNNLALFVIVLALASAASRAGFTAISPIVAAVIPYRLRAQGFAMVGIYIFLMGAFLGAVLTGMLSEAWGERVALAVVVLPSSIAGAAILASGAVHIREDMARIADELAEEQAELERMHTAGSQPMLQVRNLDFSYGQVQVLFGVDLEVAHGEIVALLGTNGAGKSTLLNCVCGLGVPSRGVIRLDGRTITDAEAEARVAAGVVLMQGGKAVWGPLTVAENLRLGAFLLRDDPEELARREQAALELFPELAERLDQPAGTLSGGQQQMLALAKALLLEPKLLLIDELSLGLSPSAADVMVSKVRALGERGLTIVLVEQSINVALSVADRAVFMEKGRVRFDGPAQDLLERGDLLRAVFLGGQGG